MHSAVMFTVCDRISIAIIGVLTKVSNVENKKMAANAEPFGLNEMFTTPQNGFTAQLPFANDASGSLEIEL